MAMRIRWYGAEHITQYGRSRATLDPRCHWTPPSGKYWPRIVPADVMVIDFSVKIDLWRCGYHFPKLAFKRHKMQNGPSTQLIKATSCIERSNIMMKVEDLS